MQIKYPDLQPIRFYKYGSTPNFLTRFPNMDNVYHRVNWIPGLEPAEYYTDWLINKEMSLQFRITVEGTENLLLYKFNTTTQIYDLHTTVTPTEITPTGWVSEKVNRYDYTFTTAGVYYFESVSAGWRSDKFVVHSNTKLTKRLVQIEYYNTVNDFFLIFFDGEIQRYSPKAYFTGRLLPDAPGNEISAFETDRGNVVKQRSTPQKRAVLEINDLHYAEIDRINQMMACNRITVNSTTYQTTDAPEMEKIEGTDLVNMTVKLIQTNWDYYKS